MSRLHVLLKCQASVAMKTHHPMMWCSVHFKSTIIWSNTLRSTVVDVYITYAWRKSDGYVKQIWAAGCSEHVFIDQGRVSTTEPRSLLSLDMDRDSLREACNFKQTIVDQTTKETFEWAWGISQQEQEQGVISHSLIEFRQEQDKTLNLKIGFVTH